LAQPHVVQPMQIATRAVQVRLEHNAEILVPGAVEIAVEIERAIGGRRVLHVDADEVPPGGSVHDDRLQVVATEVGVELEAAAGRSRGRGAPRPADRTASSRTTRA